MDELVGYLRQTHGVDEGYPSTPLSPGTVVASKKFDRIWFQVRTSWRQVSLAFIARLHEDADEHVCATLQMRAALPLGYQKTLADAFIVAAIAGAGYGEEKGEAR